MSTRRAFVAHAGGLPPKPVDPRRRKKRARILPPTVRITQQQAEERARAIEQPMPTSCAACGETLTRYNLGCGTLAPGTVLNTGHVLAEPFPFRLGICGDCGETLLRTGEVAVTLQRMEEAKDPWPEGIGRSFGRADDDDETD